MAWLLNLLTFVIYLTYFAWGQWLSINDLFWKLGKCFKPETRRRLVVHDNTDFTALERMQSEAHPYL